MYVHVLITVHVYACVHTFGVLIMLKINRAKRSDDAQPQNTSMQQQQQEEERLE